MRGLVFCLLSVGSVGSVGCGGSHRTPEDLSVGPKANGTIGTWLSSTTSPTMVPPLPTPRANHCSAASGGRIYVLGGNYEPAGASDFTTLDDVEVAEQHEDGTLSAWTRAGTLPSPVNGCTATADATRLYVVGGIYDADANDGQVWTAPLQADGSVGAFTSLGMLPAGYDVVSSQAFVRSGTLFVFDSTLPVDVDGGTDAGADQGGIVLLHAPLTATSIGSWTIDAGPPGFRGRPQYAVTSSDVYALGGYLGDDANTVVADGFGAPFDPATGMGTSFPSSMLPAPRAFGVGAGVDDWVFVMGGKTEIFSGPGLPFVFAAQVGTGGTLGSFATLSSMPEGRTNMDAVVSGSFIYVTGGGTTAGGLDNVFVAQVRF